MADHVRKQLRDAVTTRLTGLTTTGARVFGYRVDPLQMASLPGLSIWSDGDEAENATIHGPGIIDRDVTIRVAGVAAATGTVDDTLDLIGKEVETALGTALTIGSKSVLLVYQKSELRRERGEKTVGVIEMEFHGKLFTAGNAPDALL